MIEDYYAPTNHTVSLFGISHHDIAFNVKETIDWIKGEGVIFFDYWKNKKL